MSKSHLHRCISVDFFSFKNCMCGGSQPPNVEFFDFEEEIVRSKQLSFILRKRGTILTFSTPPPPPSIPHKHRRIRHIITLVSLGSSSFTLSKHIRTFPSFRRRKVVSRVDGRASHNKQQTPIAIYSKKKKRKQKS